MGSNHGSVLESNLFPSVAPRNERQLYSGSASDGLDHRVRWDNLRDLLTSGRTDQWNPNGDPELSPCLGRFLNNHLDHINVLRGLDIMFYIAHHTGGYLGNYHGNVLENSPNFVFPAMPTIDQLMGQSSHFYGSSDTRTEPVMNLGSTGPISWGFDNNQVTHLPSMANNSAALFSSLFGQQGGNTSNPNVSIIDRVLSDYNRVAQSPFGPGRRISQEDRYRLDEHVQHLRELETKLNNQGQCEATAPDSVYFRYQDSDLARQQYHWDVYMDVVTTAFKCGNSRIATFGVGNHTTYTGDYHQNIAHQNLSAFGSQELVRTNRFIAEHVFMRLVTALDEEIIPGQGTTYLDNALIVWEHESGANQHSSVSRPCITAGSAGGYFNTGLYVDYRNMSNRSMEGYNEIPGLPHNRWLYTVLQAMGVQESEYRNGAFANLVGYGDPYVGAVPSYINRQGHDPYPQRVLDDMGSPLPIIVA